MERVYTPARRLTIDWNPKRIYAAAPSSLKTKEALKIGLFLASMASFVFLFGWKLTIILTVGLYIHERGHLWGFQRLKIKNRGIYFIPFMGAVIPLEKQFSSRKSESVIAILGPIAGFIPAVAGFIIYLLTNNALFGGASVWLSLVSLLNLVPVGMMDGGRVLSAICFSCHRKIGYGFLMTGFIVSAVFTVWQSMGFVIFPIVGGLGLLIECANQEKPTIMTKPEVIKFSIIYLITAATVSAMIFYLMGNPQIYNMVSELTVK